jgi:fructose transport system ATP-binding protein
MAAEGVAMSAVQPILRARGLLKRYGTVVAMSGADFELMPGEILGVIGDNGAGKSTLIKALSGAVIPDHGTIELDGKPVHFGGPEDARRLGIETVYQNLAMSPALSIADNMFLGREWRKPGIMGSVFRQMDRPRMEKFAREKLSELGLMTIQNIQGRDPGRTHGCPGRQGIAPGAGADPRRAVARHPDHPDQPQHAPCVRGLRPRPYSPPGTQAVRDRPQGAHDVRCRGVYDRGQGA